MFETVDMFSKISPFLPRLLTILFLVVILIIFSHFSNKLFSHLSRKLRATLGIALSAFVVKFLVYSIIIMMIIFNIPGINETIIKTLGYILTGIVAFSSSTMIANGMSGLMVKFMKPFRVGNVVKIGNFLGEVAEMGTFHILIETPMREIVTIPYVDVLKDPVINYSKDTPIIHVDISLGYSTDRIKIEELLIKAADSVGLTSPYVSVMNLADHAVVYRLNGSIKEVKQIVTTESSLRKAIIDQFHLSKMEIVSPIYISQRKAEAKVLPKINKKTKKTLLAKEEVEKKEAKKIQNQAFAAADQVIEKQKSDKTSATDILDKVNKNRLVKKRVVTTKKK